LIQSDNQSTAGVPRVQFNYSYDAVDNLTNITDTINGTVKGRETRNYDALNRTIQITQSGSNVANKRVDFSYDAASQIKGMNRYSDLNGTNSIAKTNYNYDNAGRLIHLVHTKNNQTLAEYQWQYDAADRITRIISPDGTSNYTYDKTNQILNADYSYQNDENYSYDDNGNRINAGYVTGANNRLLTDGTYNYQYDKEGNRTKRIEIATGIVEESSWDYRNRLIGVVTKNSSGNIIEKVEYTYDVYNRRIAKSVDSDGDGSNPAVVERYVHDGDNLALVFDGSGNLTERFLYGIAVDQVLAQDKGNGAVLWGLGDNQGSIRLVTDKDGNVVNEITYDAFGQVTAETNVGIEFRFGYTGRELDEETGNYYYRSRYYDAAVGRFVSEDSIGFEGGDSNLYRYVANSPTNYIDPSGKTSFALQVLLTISSKVKDKPTVYIGYPEADSYSQALSWATMWFYLITIPDTRNYGSNSNNYFDGTVKGDKWTVFGQLADYFLERGKGQGTLRPSSSSPPHVPTIDLTTDYWNKTHDTPGHEKVKEVKFRYKDDKDCNNLEPSYRPQLQPNPPQEEMTPTNFPEEKPKSEPQWQFPIIPIPSIPIPNPWGENY
jgi:RHS repeat-associated protein